jgi:hypothetical protein
MLKLSGRSALEALIATKRYVLHDSQHGDLTKLKPIDGGSKRYDTNTGTVCRAQKYVYATRSLDLAIFIATVWRRLGASGWTTDGIR